MIDTKTMSEEFAEQYGAVGDAERLAIINDAIRMAALYLNQTMSDAIAEAPDELTRNSLVKIQRRKQIKMMFARRQNGFSSKTMFCAISLLRADQNVIVLINNRREADMMVGLIGNMAKELGLGGGELRGTKSFDIQYNHQRMEITNNRNKSTVRLMTPEMFKPDYHTSKMPMILMDNHFLTELL